MKRRKLSSIPQMLEICQTNGWAERKNEDCITMPGKLGSSSFYTTRLIVIIHLFNYMLLQKSAYTNEILDCKVEWSLLHSQMSSNRINIKPRFGETFLTIPIENQIHLNQFISKLEVEFCCSFFKGKSYDKCDFEIE